MALNNEDTEYELLVKQIYEQLLLEDGFANVIVKHNTKITGIRSKCNHQIDVYWEFTLAGEVYKVAIECKNFAKPVSIAKIRDFYGVIDDIGDIKGIFVSANGFQSGAKQFADTHGITLKEIRQPIDADWNGYIKSLNINLILVPSPQLQSISIGLDGKWIKENNLVFEEVNDKVNSHLGEFLDQNKYPVLYDINKTVLEDFQALRNKLPLEIEGNNLTHEFKLDDRYLLISEQLIKLHSVIFHYSYYSETMTHSFIVDGSSLVKSIVKDVKSGDIKFIRTSK